MAISYIPSGSPVKTGRLRSVVAVTANIDEVFYNTSNLVFAASVPSADVASLVGGLTPLCEYSSGGNDASFLVKVVDSQDYERVDE